VPFKRDALLTLKARYRCDPSTDAKLGQEIARWKFKLADNATRAYYESRAMTSAKGKIATSLSSDSAHHGKLLCEGMRKKLSDVWNVSF